MKNWQKNSICLILLAGISACGGPKQSQTLSGFLNESLKKSSQRDYNSANKILNEIADQVNSPEFFYNRGMNKLALHKWQEAEDDFSKARDLYKQENNQIGFEMAAQMIEHGNRLQAKNNNFMANFAARF